MRRAWTEVERQRVTLACARACVVPVHGRRLRRRPRARAWMLARAVRPRAVGRARVTSRAMPVVGRARARPLEALPQSALCGESVEALRRAIESRVESSDDGEDGDVLAIVSARAERSGKAALHLAAWRGDLKVVEALVEEYGADVDQISTGRHNYGKTPIFYALTRCRDDVVMYLLSRKCKVKIINNKGQSPYSLAVSHCARETIEAIAEAEKLETTWWNFRLTHSDGLKYGDLDERFFPEAAREPGRGVSTVESRRRNFKKLNKGVSWDNPDGVDLQARKKAELRAKREREAEEAWLEFGEFFGNRARHDADVVEMCGRILRAETAIAANGQKPDISARATEVLSRVAKGDDDFRALRALVGARLSDSGTSDRTHARAEKARRTVSKILATAVASSMSNGAWSISPSLLFEFCGSAMTYGIVRRALRHGESVPTREQLAQAIVRACEEINHRELNDVLNLEEINVSSAIQLAEVSESVRGLASNMCKRIDASDPSSIAHVAVNLADLGARVESWQKPLFAGLSAVASSLDDSVIAKVARRFADAWEIDVTEMASEDIVSCIEASVLEDLLERGDWLEAKAYASTRPRLRDVFSARAPDDVNRINASLESVSIATELPIMRPKKRVVLIEDAGALAQVREVILSASCEAFSFDCEWRDPRPLSTLQISPAHTRETFIIDALRVGKDAFSQFLIAVFGDFSVRKIGFAAEQDWRRIRISAGNAALPASYCNANVIDLQGVELVSLASVVADTLGFALDKRCQRSNWDARPLSQQQLFYAALDAEVLLDIAFRRGIISPRPFAESSSHPDAHLYSSDVVLFADGAPSYGVNLHADDARLFADDARTFGADLWESDRLLFTSPERVEQERKTAILRELERTATASASVGCACAVCLNDIHVDEKVIRTKCSHVYHATCLLTALKTTSLCCPMCRSPVI